MVIDINSVLLMGFLPKGVSYGEVYRAFCRSDFNNFESYLTAFYPDEMLRYKAARRVLYGIR